MDLLLDWEEFQESGSPVSAEDLCQDSPDLLLELKRHIASLRSVDSLLSGSPTLQKSPETKPIAGYTILNECGRGGMGIVYRALDKQRQCIVALKTLKRLDPSSLFRFKKEFRSLAGVTHQNLVGLHDFAFDGEFWFFTMDYVEGLDFLSYVRSRVSEFNQSNQPELDFDRLRHSLKQLTDGIQALHSSNILHRDLKPSNVLVTKTGKVVVLDFGLATEMNDAGQHQSTEHLVIGTAAYMAPEQGDCGLVTCATDWYSVGVMLYESLTGQLPFTGTSLQILKDKLLREPQSARRLNPSIPPALDVLCQGLLQRDPQKRFSGKDISEALSQNSPVACALVPMTHARVPLVGRDSHVAALNDAFEKVRRGGAVALFVNGNSGMGKSVLVHRFLDEHVRQTDAIALTGRCYERESVPYKALDSVIDALTKFLRHMPSLEVQSLLPRDVYAIAQVFPVLRRIDAVSDQIRYPSIMPDAQQLRRRAFAGLRELLGRLGDRHPVVIYIDDLQWGDADSAELLLEVMRPPEPPRVLVLGAFRREEATSSPFLSIWLDKSDSTIDQRNLSVDSLSHEDACQLAASLMEKSLPVDSNIFPSVARESEGNPFFIHELVEFVHTQDDFANGVMAELISLKSVLCNRIESLSQNARSLLEVVAVAGRPISQVDACLAAGVLLGENAAGALLRSGRLIRSTVPEHDEIETYHDRVRETVVARLSPEKLQERNRGLAIVLERSGQTSPEVLAEHFNSAGDARQAQRYSILAANNAVQSLAFDHAAKHYANAILLADAIDGHKGDLHLNRADALANAGRGAEAAEEYLMASHNRSDDQSMELKRLAAMQFLISGYMDEGLKLLGSVLGSVGMKMPSTPRQALWSLLVRRAELAINGLAFIPRDEAAVPPEELARIELCWSVVAGLSNVDIIRGSDFQTRSLLLALRAGEPFRIARALAVEACLVSAVGGRSTRRGAKLLNAAETLASTVRQPYAPAIVSLAKGVTAFLDGHWKIAADHCIAADRAFRELCTGVWWELDTAHTYLMWSYQYSGRYTELSRYAPGLLKEAIDRGDRYAAANLNTQIMTVIRLAADQPSHAREELQKHRWTQSGFHVQHLNSLFAQVKIDLYQGDGESAWKRMTEKWPAVKGSLLMRIQMLRIDHRFHHAACALAAANGNSSSESLLDIARRDAKLLDREAKPWAAALAQLVRAGIAGERNDTARSIHLLTDAETRLAAANLEHHAFAARRRRGEQIGGVEGQTLVAEADAWMIAQAIKDPSSMTALLAPGFV